MAREHPASARQLVVSYVLGSFVAASTFPLLGLMRGLPPRMTTGPHFFLWILPSLIPLALGFYITLRAQNRLKAGIDAEQFSPDELNSLRSTIGSIQWVAVAGGLLMISVGCMFFFALRDTHPHPSVWFFLTLAQNLMRHPAVLRAPAVKSSPVDWRQRPPLQSQHWGGR